MLSGELTELRCVHPPPFPGWGPRNGIFANFLTLCSMPTQQQRKLFSNLKQAFSHIGCWKTLMAGQDFEAMSEHKAMHYLGFLVAAFSHIRIPAICECGKPFHFYENANNPVEDQPGSSTDPVS
jgi:hypothetical protein